MKISIITVSYNSEKTIGKTFDSIRKQSYDNIEYIVIDGNSKDATVEIIKGNQDIISYWISEKDNGLYDAMNKGIKIASGDIIGILNSDDTFFNNEVVENIVSFHVDNDIQASTGNIVQHDDQGKIKRIYNSENWNPKKLKIGFMPPHPSIFLRKSVYNKFGYFREDFKIGADYEIITRFFLKNGITWEYSGITTTSMLIGGLSSSGISSYNQITKDICQSLQLNDIKYSKLKISLRLFWKLRELFIK